MNQDQELNVDVAQVGRILHFVIENGWGLKCRPAIVVEDWPGQGKPGYVNLVVYTDGKNDGAYGTDKHYHQYQRYDPAVQADPYQAPTYEVNDSLLTRWETSVMPNHAVKAKGTWHWPRECQSMHEPKAPFVKEDKSKVHHNHAEGFVDVRNCYACTLEEQTRVTG